MSFHRARLFVHSLSRCLIRRAGGDEKEFSCCKMYENDLRNKNQLFKFIICLPLHDFQYERGDETVGWGIQDVENL
jgi:hypothetical protein